MIAAFIYTFHMFLPLQGGFYGYRRVWDRYVSIYVKRIIYTRIYYVR